MNNDGIYKLLINKLDNSEILLNEPMAKHTTFNIGGPADFFIVPKNKEHLLHAIKILKDNNIPMYIIGNGSNLLVPDEGYKGAIIQIYKNFNEVVVKDTYVEAQAGVLLSKLASIICNHELSGFEFASGIPGTLGGAIYMNAGAYGGEMKDVLEEVEIITPKGEQLTLKKEALELSYRHSMLQENKYIAISAKLNFEKGNKIDIKATIDELNEKRKSKQPIEMPSAGSTFKRPEGYYAGKLIMDAGLRGFSIGGAQVSEKHCGFIVNKGKATCSDVLALIKYVQETVKQQFGVDLEPEVRLLVNKS